MQSSKKKIEVSAVRAVVRRGRIRTHQAIIAMLTLATIMVICAVLTAGPSMAQQSPETKDKLFLLVANRDMPDPVFQHTVILMLPASPMSLVAGVVINKPTKMTMGQLFSGSSKMKRSAQAVYFGGPVDLDSPIVLVRSARAPEGAVRLFEDVYASADARSIAELLQRPGSDKDLRLYLGRAQWTLAQLHSEILQGAWTITAASAALVFSANPDSLWQELIDKAKIRDIEWSIGAFPTGAADDSRRPACAISADPPDPE
jgi:putative transcriptional regulator